MLAQRRSAQSALGWLVALLLIPYVAVPLFWMLGFRKRRTGYPGLAFDRAADGGEAGTGATAPFAPLGAAQMQPGGSLTFLPGGPEAWTALSQPVRDEEVALDAMFHPVADDAVGTAFVEVLTERAQAGVRVRLMIDRLGGPSHPRAALRALEAAGASCDTSLRSSTSPLRLGSTCGTISRC